MKCLSLSWPAGRLARAAGIAVALLTLAVWAAAAPTPVDSSQAPATQPSTAPAAAPIAATTTKSDSPLRIGTTTVHLYEDPNMRIWGTFSPRQMLHLGIAAIVVFNLIGWGLLIYGIYRVKRSAAASSRQAPRAS